MANRKWTCVAQKNHESDEMEVVADQCLWDARKALEDFYSNTLHLKFKAIPIRE